MNNRFQFKKGLIVLQNLKGHSKFNFFLIDFER